MRDVQVPVPTGPFYIWGSGAGEALSTAGRLNLVRCAPNGNVVGSGPPRDWSVKHPRRYTGSFFRQSYVVVCGDAGSLGSGARGVIGRCCGRLLCSSQDCLPGFPEWTTGLEDRRRANDGPRLYAIVVAAPGLGSSTEREYKRRIQNNIFQFFYSSKPPANGILMPGQRTFPQLSHQRFARYSTRPDRPLFHDLWI